MNHPKLTISRILGRKLAMIALLLCSASASFAILGDGKKTEGPKNSLLTNKINTPGSFTLRSGYAYRGNQVFNTASEKRVIRLNTVVTMQKGNTTYIVPLKKKVVLDNVKLDFGNRSLRRN